MMGIGKVRFSKIACRLMMHSSWSACGKRKRDSQCESGRLDVPTFVVPILRVQTSHEDKSDLNQCVGVSISDDIQWSSARPSWLIRKWESILLASRACRFLLIAISTDMTGSLRKTSSSSTCSFKRTMRLFWNTGTGSPVGHSYSES